MSAIDSQLPEREPGTPRRTACAPGDPEAIWGALRREALELRRDGEADELEQTLDGWIAGAREGWGPGEWEPGDWETALEVRVPARDTATTLPLVRRGFALVGVIGVRTGIRGADAGAAEARLRAAGYRLRQASEADLPLLAELDLELLTHETQYGKISARVGAKSVLAAGLEDRLARDPEWTWILEREGDGETAGYISFEIDREQHRALCADGGPIAYLEAMYLRENVRGLRIGEALAEFGHGMVEAAGFDRALLDYAALNPRSGPFWSRMGYRPLWYNWQRRPARGPGD